ncbi:transketolase [Streptomyces coffeae]|uniref:Transketolase n=1 Tax=Streptomyces coffeae TaxID=621382 RepID=A0ABS1NCC5_9ACTN|nr:transketolase [Streptomyces coffeae]MBL1097738.1 transketolase [Streptomyces coffeae]
MSTPTTAPKPFIWSDLDRRAIDTGRVLAMDAVQRAGHGHPGTAMALAPVAYLLHQKLMRHDPADPEWSGRDRFVLSAGHSSLTLYIQLFLSGYGLTLDDLKSFRQAGSRTPGHPEYGHTAGVETTTGPLGQGVANAVGMAMAARYERGLFDPEAPEGASPFDHTVWTLAGDGCLAEGVAAEASALAGHQQLGNLVLIWDDNRITIEGDTHTATSENVLARYEAYGWHVQYVAARPDGDVDETALHEALETARAETGRPSLVAVRTVIAWPAPNARNTAASHGSALGSDEVAATKKLLGFQPQHSFEVAEEVLAHTRDIGRRGHAARADWERQLQQWQSEHPRRAAEFERIRAGELPTDWAAAIPRFPAGGAMATRKASGEVLKALGPVLPELWGGSADLAGSNNTTIDALSSFLPADNPLPTADPYGRTIHFGIREHAMGAAMNGIVLHGNTRIYGGTFLVFSDYMRPAVRMAALMRLPVTYVWTHDSIGLGEDGPTHQPVEHLASLRAIPGLNVVRPADANETAIVWAEIVRRHSARPAPHGLCLTRQSVPIHGANEEAARGGYVLLEAEGGAPQVILIATGSEVQLAVTARAELQADGIPARVVSMPCREWFEEQDQEWRDRVLPPSARARVSVEAGVAQGWRDYIGDAGRSVSLERFGASADHRFLYEQFGITAQAVADAARASLAAAGS